ncbi:MAG: Arylsulfatase [Candidatus Moanabacter tarae]|uniref:Arylsulfatase n=1 Tax=Candidatus Moanibacter tarae TaxID=2200854 RepID=A0A2Z4AGZ6_9BACT|nr:MAG: Arylsulfatase [Candidatus Moanabacter tarae]|tara:strand:- start:8466 stop:9950 length:1485 start_codon:yes stop_codon:yes gene_type:complete
MKKKSEERPNVIFIMPDQLRHDFLSCYGASFIHTPNIDSLGSRGILFRNAYSEHPVCVAARASLLTGMNAIKTGVLNNEQFIRPDYRICGLQTWPELLSEAGYYTVGIGKMHFYPWEKHFGFQHRIIAEDKLWGFIEDDYFHILHKAGYSKRDFIKVPEYHKNHMACISPHPWEYNVDHFVGKNTAKWISEYDGEAPFAMMVGFPGPHSPYDPALEYATFDPGDMPEPHPAEAKDTSVMHVPKPVGPNSKRKSWYAVRNEISPTRDTFLMQRACYTGLVAQIDLEVGRILDSLRRKGILENTIIIFSSDHGDYLGDHGLIGKGSYYEAACHVPMLVSHPRFNEAKISEELVTLTDTTATILSLAGIKVPSYMDSRPMPGLGQSNEEARKHVFGILKDRWMLFDGRWKLCKYPKGSHLFDLMEDPGEQLNRAIDPKFSNIFHRLDTILTSEMMRSTYEAGFPERINTAFNSSSPEFGRPGSDRTYPMPWGETHPD